MWGLFKGDGGTKAVKSISKQIKKGKVKKIRTYKGGPGSTSDSMDDFTAGAMAAGLAHTDKKALQSKLRAKNGAKRKLKGKGKKAVVRK
jgi:hypothetical protein